MILKCRLHLLFALADGGSIATFLFGGSQGGVGGGEQDVGIEFGVGVRYGIPGAGPYRPAA